MGPCEHPSLHDGIVCICWAGGHGCCVSVHSGKSAVGVTNRFLTGFKMCFTEGTDVGHYKPSPTAVAGEAMDNVLLNGHGVPVKSILNNCSCSQISTALCFGRRCLLRLDSANYRES